MDAESHRMEAESRLTRLRAMLEARGCDGYFSDAAPQNQYLTGFRGSTSIVLVTQREAVFLCDSRYTEQAQSQVAAYEVQEAEGSMTKAAGELLRRLGVRYVVLHRPLFAVDGIARCAPRAARAIRAAGFRRLMSDADIVLYTRSGA